MSQWDQPSKDSGYNDKHYVSVLLKYIVPQKSTCCVHHNMCKRKKFSYAAIGVIKLNRLLWAAVRTFRILNIINTAENKVVRQ